MQVVTPQFTGTVSVIPEASPEPQDSVITVPNLLLPVMEIPRRHQFPANLGTEFAQSFLRTDQLTLTNGPLLQSFSAVLVAGIWDFNYQISYEANYTNANPIAVDGALLLRQPVATDCFLFHTAARISRLVIAPPPVRLVLQAPTTVVLRLGANGAAQTHTIEAFMQAQRLL